MWTPPWQDESGTILKNGRLQSYVRPSMRCVEPLALMNLRGLDP